MPKAPAKHLVVLLAVAVAGATAVAAASLSAAIPEAANLLRLIGLVDSRTRQLTVDDVAAAYKDYVNLYEMQAQLAADSDSAANENRYEQINEILAADGLDEIAASLFAPFNGSELRGELTGHMRMGVLKAIAELSSQWSDNKD